MESYYILSRHIQLKTGNKFNRKYARTELIVCCMLKVLLNLHIFQLLSINCSERCQGRIWGEGAGGAHPPWDYLQFSNTTGILRKKKNWFIGVEVKSKRRVHSLLKEILDPPLRVLVRFLEGSYIIVQVLKCKIPERVLFTERFSKVSRRWRCASCHPLQVLLLSRCQKTVIWQYYYFYYF